MAGGNHPKGPSNKPSSSSSSHRKTRWESDQQKPSPAKDNLNLPPPKPFPIPSPKPLSNPNPNPNPNPGPSLSEPSFPGDLGPPPPPAYGFHMLDRRTIVLADGSVRSYFALPPDYQDFPPQRRFLPPQEIPGQGFPLKRKFGDEREERERDEFARQRQQLLQYGNAGSGSSPYNLGRGDEMRAPKQMRSDGGGYEGRGFAGAKHIEVDQAALKKAFLHFAKVVNEDTNLKKKYLADGKQGSLQCVACARSSKDFPDMHGLVMHTYNSDSADSRVDHLGLHKVLCILMGWNFSMPPDNSKAYQSLSAAEAAANQDDLIMWPPLVIIHNTNTGKLRDGRLEGLGNKAMDIKIKDLGFGGKSKSLYGREGHLGITLMKYGGDQSGLKEAVRLAEFFEKENHGRRDWSLMQSLTSSGKDDENNPNLVKVDPKTGEKERIFYGYLATVSDLDKIDPETRKKAVIESMRELFSQ